MPKSNTPQIKSATAEPTVKFILAEADTAEIAKIKSQIDVRWHQGIRVVNNYTQLVERVSIESPELVLLSRIDATDFGKICKTCRQDRVDLPIFLLSKTTIISDSFRNLVKTVGISDVISQTAADLDRLFSPYLAFDLPESVNLPTFSGKIIGVVLMEIVDFCSSYFGDLAQGNYWRKTHVLLTDRCPSLRYWSADRFGKITVDATIADRELTDRQLQDLRLWVQAFLDECERSVPDFRTLIDRAKLSVTARYLLLNPDSG